MHWRIHYPILLARWRWKQSCLQSPWTDVWHRTAYRKHKHLLASNPKLSTTPKEQSELISQTVTIFECLGQPIMPLVVLDWWKHHKSTIKQTTYIPTSMQNITTYSSTGPGLDTLLSGTIDMNSWSFGLCQKPSRTSQQSQPIVLKLKVETLVLLTNDGDLPVHRSCRITLSRQIIEVCIPRFISSIFRLHLYILPTSFEYGHLVFEPQLQQLRFKRFLWEGQENNIRFSLALWTQSTYDHITIMQHGHEVYFGTLVINTNQIIVTVLIKS